MEQQPEYSARVVQKIGNRPGTWNYLEVGVFRTQGEVEEQIGAYQRNYPSLFHTFCPFQVEGRDYALYSLDYTATRVMELPACRDLGGEERAANGFCPVEYFVPSWLERENVTPDDEVRRTRVNNPKPEQLLDTVIEWSRQDPATGAWTKVARPSRVVTQRRYYPFGFVAGCIWGDDSSWKIQYLDLSEAPQGIIRRDERFGYVELPDNLRLEQALDMFEYLQEPEEEYAYWITMTVQQKFDVRSGKRIGKDGCCDD